MDLKRVMASIQFLKVVGMSTDVNRLVLCNSGVWLRFQLVQGNLRPFEIIVKFSFPRS